jgi:hypothetical protein
MYDRVKPQITRDTTADVLCKDLQIRKNGSLWRWTHTVVREYFAHRVPIPAVSRAETLNARFHSGAESRTTV